MIEHIYRKVHKIKMYSLINNYKAKSCVATNQLKRQNQAGTRSRCGPRPPSRRPHMSLCLSSCPYFTQEDTEAQVG